MTSYHGWTHAPKEQGGTDPIPFPSASATTSVYLDQIDANGTGLDVGADNWELLVDGVDLANSRWLNRSNYDPDGQWAIDFSTGSINNNASDAYNYSVFGYVVFDGTLPDGTILGVALAVGGEFHVNTIEVQDGGVELGCYAERTPLGAAGARVWVYCSVGTSFIAAARLHVRRFELYDGVYEQGFAT